MQSFACPPQPREPPYAPALRVQQSQGPDLGQGSLASVCRPEGPSRPSAPAVAQSCSPPQAPLCGLGPRRLPWGPGAAMPTLRETRLPWGEAWTWGGGADRAERQGVLCKRGTAPWRNACLRVTGTPVPRDGSLPWACSLLTTGLALPARVSQPLPAGQRSRTSPKVKCEDGHQHMGLWSPTDRRGTASTGDTGSPLPWSRPWTVPGQRPLWSSWARP